MMFAVLISVGAAIWIWRDFEGTEFSGGRVTGPLLHVFEIGIASLVLGLILAPLKTRVAAVITLLGAFFCFPFYLYFITPGPFRWIFPGEYTVPATGNFVWINWGILGVFTLGVTALLAGSLLKRNSLHDSV